MAPAPRPEQSPLRSESCSSNSPLDKDRDCMAQALADERLAEIKRCNFCDDKYPLPEGSGLEHRLQYKVFFLCPQCLDRRLSGTSEGLVPLCHVGRSCGFCDGPSSWRVKAGLCNYCEDTYGDLGHDAELFDFADFNDINLVRERLVTKILFLRSFFPSPRSKEFKGDVIVVGKDPDQLSIQAHEFILAGRSRTFDIKLRVLNQFRTHTIGKEGSGVKTVVVDEISGVALRAAINFLYTGEIEFSLEVRPLDVLKFAHKYQIDELKLECEIAIAKKIDARNLANLLQQAWCYGAKHLNQAAREFLKDHPEELDKVLDELVRTFEPQTLTGYQSDGGMPCTPHVLDEYVTGRC